MRLAAWTSIGCLPDSFPENFPAVIKQAYVFQQIWHASVHYPIAGWTDNY